MNPIKDEPFREIRALPDGEQKDRLLERVAAAIRAERERMGLPPIRPVDRSSLLCGCPRDPAVGPSRIDDQGGCTVCVPA